MISYDFYVFWGGALFYFPLFPLRIFDQLQLHYTDRLLPGIPRCFTTSAWVANSLIALEKSGFLGFVCHRSGCMRRRLFFLGGKKHGTWLVIRVALGCWERDMCNSNYVCFLRIFFVFLKHQTHISRILQKKHCGGFMITWSLRRLPWNHDKSWILQNSATRREEHRKYAGLDHAMLLEFTMMCALACNWWRLMVELCTLAPGYGRTVQ